VAAQVEAAHSRAIDSSLAYLEEHALFTRRGHNGVEQLAGEGLVASRSCNSSAHIRLGVTKLSPSTTDGTRPKNCCCWNEQSSIKPLRALAGR
jgi:hypothetical protein